MTAALRHMSDTERKIAIKRRLAQKDFKGLGYWAAVDATRYDKPKDNPNTR